MSSDPASPASPPDAVEPTAPAPAPPASDAGPPSADQVKLALRKVKDPELNLNIVDLGLIYECEVHLNEDGTRTVGVKMTLTAPGCGMGEVLVTDVRDKIERIPTVRVADVELVFDPPWDRSMMSEAARLQTGMY